MDETQEERLAIMTIDGGLSEEGARRAIVEEPTEELRISNQFLNEFVTSVQLVSDANPVFTLFGGLGLLSGLMHKYYFYAPELMHLNLFLFMLGPSSAPRKTTIVRILINYLSEVDKDLILGSELTPESLMYSMEVQNHRVLFSRELNHFLEQVLGPDYNHGLGVTLANIYDGGPGVSRLTVKRGEVKLDDPVLTIIGAGVDEYLIPKIKTIDLVSGFWPRVTLVHLPKCPAGKFRMPGKFVPLPHILNKLKTLSTGKGGEIGLGKIEDSFAAYSENLQKEAEELNNPNLIAGFLRLQWITIKIAAILTLADNPESKQISPQAFKDAVILVNYVKQGLPNFYAERLADSSEYKIAQKALEFIKKNYIRGKAIPYRLILQYSHCKTSELKCAMQRLVDTGDVNELIIPSTNQGGRPGKAYEPL